MKTGSFKEAGKKKKINALEVYYLDGRSEAAQFDPPKRKVTSNKKSSKGKNPLGHSKKKREGDAAKRTISRLNSICRKNDDACKKRKKTGTVQR